MMGRVGSGHETAEVGVLFYIYTIERMFDNFI